MLFFILSCKTIAHHGSLTIYNIALAIVFIHEIDHFLPYWRATDVPKQDCEKGITPIVEIWKY